MGDSFDSPQEEAAHYREKYRRILDMLEETRAELGTSANDSSPISADRMQTSFRFRQKSSRMSWKRNWQQPRSSRQI